MNNDQTDYDYYGCDNISEISINNRKKILAKFCKQRDITLKKKTGNSKKNSFVNVSNSKLLDNIHNNNNTPTNDNDDIFDPDNSRLNSNYKSKRNNKYYYNSNNSFNNKSYNKLDESKDSGILQSEKQADDEKLMNSDFLNVAYIQER